MFHGCQTACDFRSVRAYVHDRANFAGFLIGETAANMVGALAFLFPLAHRLISDARQCQESLVTGLVDGITTDGGMPDRPSEVELKSFIAAVDRQDERASGRQHTTEHGINAFGRQTAVKEQGGLLRTSHA